MIDNDLKIVAYHEAGHAVVTCLLGISLQYIQMTYSKQARKWAGRSIKGSLPQPTPLYLNLDTSILQLQRPNDPEPYEEYKLVRKHCIIAYAGVVAEELFYRQYEIDENPEQLEETALDIKEVKERIAQRFPSGEWEEEIHYAKSHARVILGDPIIWRLVENVVENLMNYIQSTEPDEQDFYWRHWYFCAPRIYDSIKKTLIDA